LNVMKWFPSFRRGAAAAVREPSPRPPSASSENLTIIASDEDDKLVGKKLNDTYLIDAVVGSGGMGRVYRARHTRIPSKEFAIKILKQEFTKNPEVLTRFRREAEAAASVGHPNVVGVYDVDTTPDGHSYMVCEYLKGRDLADEIAASGPLEIQFAVHVALEVCRALEAAHARGVVHRDLKPHNVFLLADETGVIPPRPAVKVLDFGLSRFVDSPGTQLTQTGVIMGTPAYMAPEQADGTGVDHRTDIYGMGAVLFAALCGRPPFEAETLQAVVLAVLTQEAPQARSVNPMIPENLELVVQRAMSRRREERYQSMADLRRALEPFALVEGVQMLDPVSVRSAQSSRLRLDIDARTVSTARPRLLMYSALALALLIAGLSSTLPAIELVTGKLNFTKSEAALFLLGVLGTLLTPTLLLVARVRRTVWGNHARVLGLLESVRGVLLAAVLSYGLAALLVRFLDDVVARFFTLGMLGQEQARGWAGWNLLFLVIALLMGAISGARIGIERATSGWLARRATPILSLAGALVSVFILYAGFVWRNHTAVALDPGAEKPPPVASAPASAAPAAPTGIIARTSPPAAPATPAADAPGSPSSKVAHAPSDELAAAVAKGVDGLLPLAERFPKDPAVLKPLVIAFASRSTGLADSMVVATRLFEVAPEQAADDDLRFLVKKAAATPGEASKIAFEAMVSHMAGAGPDLLYELMLSDAKVSRQAQALLTSPAVREKTSPALAVAYDLRVTSSCAAKVPLLERAAQLGDERSVAILLPLATGSKKGCGKRRRDPCAPPCAEEAKRFQDAIAKIASRTGAPRR
jgi:serine/threonine protein kinase